MSQNNKVATTKGNKKAVAKKLAKAIARLSGSRRKGRKLTQAEKDAAKERLKPYQFKKGDPRTKLSPGRPRNLNIAEEIAHAVLEADPEAAIRAFVKKLKNGDKFVFEAMADRAFGKPKQDIGLGVADPLQTLIDEFQNESEKLEEEAQD